MGLEKFQEYQSKGILISLNDLNILQQKYSRFLIIPMEKQIPSQKKIWVTLTARFYIGLIHVSNELDIMIQPKVPADFLNMLLYVDPEKLHVWHELVDNVNTSENFIELFIKTFLEDTHDLLIQKRQQAYEINRDWKKIPQGKILLKSTIHQNYKIPKKFYCQTSLFSLNNIHNQIIKFTLLHIRPLISSEILPCYQTLLKILELVEQNPNCVKELDRVKYNRLTEVYRKIHDFCRLILKDFSLDFDVGQNKFYAFILNAWSVYEKFLLGIFQAKQSIYRVDPYVMRDYSLKYDWENTDHPDFIFTHIKTKKQFLIDAKYKQSYSLQDRNQMSHYLANWDPVLVWGMLIYPRDEDNIQKDFKSEFRIQTIWVKWIDLKQIKKREELEKFVNSVIKCFEMDTDIL